MEVITLEDILSQSSAQSIKKTEQNTKNENEESDSSEATVSETEKSFPRGRPKSGRVWKQQKSRFSSIIKTPGLRNSKEKKYLLRTELKRVKEHSRALVEERKREKEERRLRRQANLKRQEENRRKAEIVQVIKNTSKIKRMRKKHLRQIEKRDTTMLIK